MILVPVGEYISAHAILVGHQVAGVRDHQVDAQHIILGKHGAAVHHDDVFVVLKHRDVLAEFINAAQGDDSQFRSVYHMFLLSLILISPAEKIYNS